jgi:hypothetical protein
MNWPHCENARRDFVGFYCEGSDGGRRHRPARARGNSEALGLKQDHNTMSDDLKFQLRLTLSDEFAQVTRNDPGDPSISTLTEILNRHDAVMKCQFDAFAGYVSEAEANGIENFHLYEWTKKTIDDPAKKAKYTKSFTLYVGGNEVYEKDKANALEAELKPLVGGPIVAKMFKYDTDPVHNPQPPRQIYGGDRTTSPHVHQREGEVPPAATLHRLVDPKHGERLQQPCVLQRTRINYLKTELTHELHHPQLAAGIVAGDQHDGLDRIFGGLGHVAGPRHVQRLEDSGARGPTCNLLAGRGVEAEDKLQSVWTHAQWVRAVDHDLTRETAQTSDRPLGRGPRRRDHHDFGLFDGFRWRSDAFLGKRRMFWIGWIA